MSCPAVIKCGTAHCITCEIESSSIFHLNTRTGLNGEVVRDNCTDYTHYLENVHIAYKCYTTYTLGVFTTTRQPPTALSDEHLRSGIGSPSHIYVPIHASNVSKVHTYCPFRMNRAVEWEAFGQRTHTHGTGNSIELVFLC